MLTLGLFGTPLFRFIFGNQWIEAGIYAQILAGWYFLVFLDYPLNIFALLNKQDIGLGFTVLSLAGRVTGLLIGVTLGTPRLALGLFVLFSILFLIGKIFLKLQLSQVSWVWACKVFLKHTSLSCLLLLPVKGVSWIFPDIRVLLGGLTFATICYSILLFFTEPALRQFVISIWKKVEERT